MISFYFNLFMDRFFFIDLVGCERVVDVIDIDK